MERFKIFSGRDESQIYKEANDFIENTKGVEIINWKLKVVTDGQSNMWSNRFLYLTIFYKNSQSPKE